jgi:hypothetical protein
MLVLNANEKLMCHRPISEKHLTMSRRSDMIYTCWGYFRLTSKTRKFINKEQGLEMYIRKILSNIELRTRQVIVLFTI